LCHRHSFYPDLKITRHPERGREGGGRGEKGKGNRSDGVPASFTPRADILALRGKGGERKGKTQAWLLARCSAFFVPQFALVERPSGVYEKGEKKKGKKKKRIVNTPIPLQRCATAQDGGEKKGRKKKGGKNRYGEVRYFLYYAP